MAGGTFISKTIVDCGCPTTPNIPELAARGETPAAFGRRCIPADCVAPPSNIPDILSRRALSSGRLAALGATLDFRHGLLRGAMDSRDVINSIFGSPRALIGVIHVQALPGTPSSRNSVAAI